MPTALQLREQRQVAWTQAKEFNDRHAAGDDMSAEDNGAWERALNDVDRLTVEVDNIERTGTLDSRFAEIDTQTRDSIGGATADEKDGKYRSAFEKYLRHGLDRCDAEERALVMAAFSPDVRAQSEGTTTAGGFTVPQGFWAKVTETMKYYGGMLDAAYVLDTDNGITLPWATNDDTGNSGALLAENAQVTGQDLVFGQKSLSAYMYTSKLILVSLQLLQDTGIDLEAFLAKKIGQRLGRIFNTHLTTGTGGGTQPQGFVAGASTGATGATVSTITFDNIIDLLHSVDVAYRTGARFMMHDLVLAVVRKLKDSQGRYLWEPSAQTGIPSTIEGYPYTVNNDMASTVATGNKTMAFGNFEEGYVARRVAGGQMMRLAERYADFLQVGFFGFARLDGLLQDASAIKLLVQP